MDLFNIELGLPGGRKAGYGVTKKEVRFENESVLIMEATPELTPNADGKMPKANRRFLLSPLAIKNLGFLCTDFEKTDEFKNELIYVGNANNGSVFLLLNTTKADENTRNASSTFAKQGSFSSKPLYDQLVKIYGLDTTVENLFTLETVDPTLTNGYDSMVILPYKGVEFELANEISADEDGIDSDPENENETVTLTETES